MKTFFGIYLVFLLCILISCGENNGPNVKTTYNEIPDKDRFIYELGDALIYQCSDGSSISFSVIDYKFWTETSSSSLLGTQYQSETQLQRVIIESSSDNWNSIFKKVFSSEDFIFPCYSIETIYTVFDSNGNPACWIVNGCNGEGTVFAESGVMYAEISINNNSYQKVYFDSRDAENISYKIYWNLKYGIIRFECIDDGNELIWDLEDPKM